VPRGAQSDLRAGMDQADLRNDGGLGDRPLAGDYVDRGAWGIELLSLLLAMKLAFPTHVYLLRGGLGVGRPGMPPAIAHLQLLRGTGGE